MINTKRPPHAPNKQKEEYNVDFEKLDKWFSILQNIKPSLKITDWNNSQLDSVVLKKRDWTIPYIDTLLDNTKSQYLYNDREWNETHIASDWKVFKKINDWNVVNIQTDTLLSWINWLSYNSVNWYISENNIFKWTNSIWIIWAWTAVEYDWNSDLSKLTILWKQWEDNELLWRVVSPDSNNESIIYDIEENWEDWIKVKWDIIWLSTTTTTVLNTTDTSVTVDSTVWLPTWGWELQIGLNGDYIYYTAIQWNVIDWVTWISINYPIWTQIKSWLSRASVWWTFIIKHTSSSDKVVDLEKHFKTGSWWELVWKTIVIKSWTWAWQSRTITNNTSDTITVNLPFKPVLDSSSNYEIYSEDWQILYISNWENNLLRYSWNSITETNAPSWKYMDTFDWRLFVWNTSNVVEWYISINTTLFTWLWATSIKISDVSDIATSWDINISFNWDVYSINYTWIDVPNKTLTWVTWLTNNLEKWYTLKLKFKVRKWVLWWAWIVWSNLQLSLSNRQYDINELKWLYILFTNWTWAWKWWYKIISNTSNTIDIDWWIIDIPDNTTEYQIYANNKFSVYYSEINDYENFNVFTNFITPPWTDEITWLKQWNDRIIIFKRNSIWSVLFTFNTTLWTWQPKLDRIPTDTWCIDWNSIAQVEDQLWFFDWNQYKSVWFSDTQIWVLKTDSVSFPINNMFKNIQSISEWLHIVAWYYNNTFYFAPTHKDWANTVYIYDYEYTTWIVYTWLDIGSLISNEDWKIYHWEKLWWVIHTFEEWVYSDNWTPVNASIQTRTIDIWNNHLYKKFKMSSFVFENIVSTTEILAIINAASEIRQVWENVRIWIDSYWWLSSWWFSELWFWDWNRSNINANLLSTFKKNISKRWISIKLIVNNNNDEQISLWWIWFTYEWLKEQMFPNKLIY